MMKMMNFNFFILFLALYKQNFKAYTRLYSITFEDIYVKENTFFYFNLKVFSLVLDKFLLLNSKQFGN